MIAKPIHIIALVFVASATVFAFQGQVPTDAGRRADIYAIYSQVIKDERPNSDSSFLIQETTLSAATGFGNTWRPREQMGLDGLPPFPGQQAPGMQCPVRPPAAEVPTFQEILADYALRKDMSVTLGKEFTLDRPYEFVNGAQVDKFLRDASAAHPQVGQPVLNTNPLAQKAGRIIRLGDVYFNRQGSVAITYLSVLTTTSNGGGGWKVFRRIAPGNWQQDSNWQTCDWNTVA